MEDSIIVVLLTFVVYFTSYLLSNAKSVYGTTVDSERSKLALASTISWYTGGVEQKKEKPPIDHLVEETTRDNTDTGYIDEYDDDKFLIEPTTLLKSIRNIVVDGANFLYYINQLDYKQSHNDRFKQAAELCSKLFPTKRVFFVIKDVSETVAKSLNKRNLFIVHVHGDAKARDDFAALDVYQTLSDLLHDTILLTRDRYRDIMNIVSSNPLTYRIYSSSAIQAKKYEKLFIGDTQKFKNLGGWLTKTNLVGYSYNVNKPSAVYLRKIKTWGKVAGHSSNKVFLFDRLS